MSLPCYHVTCSSGDVYGVACSGKLEAKLLVQARLVDDESDDAPLRAERVATWSAPFGTVLCYGPTR